MKWKNVRGAALSLMGLLLIIPWLISGCAGGGTETSNPSMDSGEVYISLTDAEGDFISYQVDVTSITLEKLNGAVVEALPVSTSVDFAALTDLTELVTAATIPSGFYRKAVMTLDYSNSQILAEDANGDPVPLTPKIDADGNPISQLDVSVSLSNRKLLYIAPGVPASLTLDFDLLATNEVDLENEIVIVRPMLSAEVNVKSTKPHRIRGPLVSVDESEMSFVLKVWPGLLSNGKVTVFATESTVFEVDGEEGVGSAGLGLLAAKDPTTAVLALVNFNLQTFKLEAEQVFAGSSVAGGELDGLTGTIIKRVGDVLTVRGASLERASGTFFINSDVEVQLGNETTVIRPKSDGVLIDDLSVGQRIVALGQYQENGAVGAVEVPGTFDATQGVVRMIQTAAAGQVVAKSDGQLVLDLQRLDGRRTDALTLFDFSGTGATAESDADPGNYEIDVGTLSLDTVVPGDSVRVFGFVTPFGSAAPPDEYDFEAVSIVNATDAKANIAVNWKFFAGSTLSVDNDSLVLDLTDAGIFHHVFRLWISLVLDIEQTPTVVCDDAAGNGIFTISQGGSAAVYTDYSEFIAALSSELKAGTQALVLTGAGYFDDPTLTFSAKKINIILK